MEASLTTLQKFVVRRVRRTYRELGVGAHGSVEELEADGTTYAGKRIHDALVEFEDNLVSQRFVSECQLMSELRHPHVVQFIGVCFFVGSRFPILVMEYLPENLDHLLEATPKIPLLLHSVWHTFMVVILPSFTAISLQEMFSLTQIREQRLLILV